MKRLLKPVLIVGLYTLTITPSIQARDRHLEPQSQVVTHHKTTVNGKAFDYTATAGTQPVWDKDGKTIAALFYTYYTRDKVKNRENRPLLISFNGGPGSASVWMHIAYTGPRILKIDDEGYPVQPYGIKNNPFSVLDIADIVYVNPVNTGYSRIINKAGESNAKKGKKTKSSKQQLRKKFFGVNADIKYLAEWLNTFVTRNNRWLSPKYLIGESYGTTRVSGLALELQNAQWMYLNGVILVSPTGLGIKRDGPVRSANRLPYFAAAAWYHKVLTHDLQQLKLNQLLAKVEKYTLETYLPALTRGSAITENDKNQVAAQVARYSGLSEKFVQQHNLDISTRAFWKELLRAQGKTIGRLDSRYLGLDKMAAGDSPDYNAELSSWLHSFTPAINYYLREILKYKTDIKYNMFGDVHPWDRKNDHTGENLRLAMAENPYMKVMIQSGYFDGATSYFDAKYTLWHLDPAGTMKKRLSFHGYQSGHMMYLRRADLKTANEDIRQFIKSSLPAKNQPAKY